MLQSELERFVVEDLGYWDESSSIVPDEPALAEVLAKEECVISGLEEAQEIASFFGLTSEHLYDDGEYVPPGSTVLTLQGRARNILRGERLLLNFLGRMSGISTLTRSCVLKAGGVKVACTRKTTPGFRYFEKRAVLLGGGDPHRFNLSGAVMIKDNHIKLMGLEKSIQVAKARSSFTKRIEVEVEDLASLLKAAELGADIIMLDNMGPETIKEGVRLLVNKGLRKAVILEASGGINPENLEEYASSGVDVISLGALTKNARWIDFSLDIVQCSRE
jgi:nicotinate-nucleotide pyrophosphorylase (carboxylating)